MALTIADKTDIPTNPDGQAKVPEFNTLNIRAVLQAR